MRTRYEFETALVVAVDVVVAGVVGASVDVEGLVLVELVCFAFLFVQSYFLWPLVWQKKHRCSAM